MKKLIYLCSLLLLCSCAQENPVVGPQEKEEEKPAEMLPYGPSEQYEVLEALPTKGGMFVSDADRALLNALNEATFNAYILSEKSLENQMDSHSGNYAVSPMSAAMCMALTANSIDEPWASSSAAIMGLGSADAAKDFFLKMMKYLPDERTGLPMHMANSIWYASKFKVDEAFKAMMQGDLRVPVTALNFIDDDFAAIINKWGEENTDGLIKKCCPDDLDPAKIIALWANALYFRGRWETPFDPANTNPMEFNGRDRKGNPDAMHYLAAMSYAEANGCQMVRLYFEKEIYSLDIIKCNEGKLTADLYDQLLKYREPAMVDIYLPKFEVNTRAVLNPLYPGLEKSLSGATFDRMGFENASLKTSMLMQNSIFGIDEVGAYGAAVTTQTSEGYGPPTRKVTAKFDSPFTFVLRNNDIGAIVFIGRINNLD